MDNLSRFKKRREIFLEHLNGAAAIIPSASLVTHHADCEYPFRQNSDFWYLTGLDEPDAIALFLSHESKNYKFILFVQSKDTLQEVWHGKKTGKIDAVNIYGADIAHDIGEFQIKLNDYIEGAKEIVFPIGENKQLESVVLNNWSELLSKFPRSGNSPISLKSSNIYLHEMRLIKDDFEIKRIKEAARISAAAHELARESVVHDMNERQIQGIIEGFFLQQCTRGPAYGSIVASGDNACVLHYTLNNSLLKNGDLVLVDAGCSLYDYYNADITRTFPVSGKFTSQQKDIYEIVLSAQKTAIKNVKVGMTSGEIHLAALMVIISGLKQLGLLKGSEEEIINNGSYKHLFMHQTGHWLGLDVHDVGAYRLGEKEISLQPGMVLTIEPGIYISDRLPIPFDQPEIKDHWKGIGIRIEDDILVTSHGPEVLTSAALKEIKDLEN